MPESEWLDLGVSVSGHRSQISCMLGSEYQNIRISEYQNIRISEYQSQSLWRLESEKPNAGVRISACLSQSIPMPESEYQNAPNQNFWMSKHPKTEVETSRCRSTLTSKANETKTIVIASVSDDAVSRMIHHLVETYLNAGLNARVRMLQSLSQDTWIT